MPVLLIQDFLQTQGLKLSSDDLRIAYLTTKTVMDMGNASIDRSVLWREEDGWKLADHIEETPENEVLLKQVFMALDSVFSRATAVKSAAANRMQGWFVSRRKASLWKICWLFMKKTVRFTLPAVRRKAVG